MKSLIGFSPNNLNLFREAFTHRSAIAVKEKGALSNERLEFVGDAVLGLILGEYLFHEFPGENEGFLSKMRSRIVNRELFNQIGLQLKLDDWMLKIAPNSADYKHAPDIIGNCFEALVGAIFLDKGYDYAKRFYIQTVLKDLLNIEKVQSDDNNYKSRLLEWGQKNGHEIEFKVQNVTKNGQKLEFEVAVFINQKLSGTGIGTKKKKAEQMAAQEALGKVSEF